jgi:hypothetical protein
MARAFRAIAMVAGALSIGVSVAPAQPLPRVDVRLELGEAQLEPEVVAKAKTEVARIYREAGLMLVWNSAGETDTEPTQKYLRRSLLVLVRADDTPVRLRLPESALGMAQSSIAERGRVAFIFWNRITAAALKHRDWYVGVEQVLAVAIAHEIGHFLLPPGHSPAGLMKASWDGHDFLLAGRGALTLSSRDAAAIRARLLNPGMDGQTVTQRAATQSLLSW